MKRSQVLAVGIIAMLGPFSYDTYIAAMPQMAADLMAPHAYIQMTVLVNLAGMTLGQLFVGPYSDSRGRVGPIRWALAGFTLATLLIAVSGSLWLILGLRVLQGFSVGAAFPVSQAMVRDRAQGQEAARIFSIMTIVKSVAPVVAPVIGAILLNLGNWRFIFAFLAIIGAVSLVWITTSLPESLAPENRKPFKPSALFSGWSAPLRDRNFLATSVASVFMTAALFTYLSGSSFALQTDLGLSVNQYTAFLLVNALGLVGAGMLNQRLLKRYKPSRLFASGLATGLAASVFLLISVSPVGGFWYMAVGLLLSFSSVGIILPNSMALALENQGANAGSAAGLMGVATSAAGALSMLLYASIGASTARQLSIYIAVAGVLSCLALVLRPKKAPAVLA